MTYRVTASVGSTRLFTGEPTSFALGSPPPAPLLLASFSPSQAPVGAVVTLYGTGFAAGMTARFSSGALLAGTVTVLSATQATVVVPVGAASGTLRVTVGGTSADSAGSFTVGPLLATDAFAVLPTRTPRYGVLPPARNGVPAERIARLTLASTWDDLKAAAATVSVHRDAGTCWVLIPEGANITPAGVQASYTGPDDATPRAFPLVFANAEWFDGVRVYSTGAMLTKAQADAQPTIRPCRVSASEGPSAEYDPWMTWTSKSDVVCIGIRALDNASGIGYTRCAWAIGDSFVGKDGDDVGHFAAWWCSTGLQQNGEGKPFTAAGNWRGGMGRAFQVNGSGFAARNCYHYGHGAPSGLGSDRGYLSGWASTGPWLVKGCDIKDPGGIGSMHGGAGNNGNVLEDWTMQESIWERTDGWNADDPVNGWVDASGARCPYAGKNIQEIKEARRVLFEKCFFLNDFTSGQQYAINWKSAWQGSHGVNVGSNDLTMRLCVVTSRNKGVFGFSLAEGETADAALDNGTLINPTGALVLGVQRVSIHDNLLIARGGLPSVGSGNTGQANVMMIGREARGSGRGTPPVLVGRQPEKVNVSRNLMWIYELGAGASSRGVIMNGVSGAKSLPEWVLANNVIGAAPASGGGSGMTYLWRNEGLDLDGARLDRLADYVNRPDAFPSATIGRNVFVGVPGGLNGGVPTPQVEYASAAAAGLVVTSPTEYSYAPGGALAGEAVKPDLAAVAAVRSNLLAGVVS